MNSTPNVRRPIITVLWLAGFNSPHAQDQENWDVTLPRGDTREISFTTEEGTWMSVDISPDRRWVVFDLLGHIYRLPVTGGQAVSLTQDSGIAMNYHPRISPDGREIAFVSDRGGQDNLWVMAADGSSPTPIFADMDARVAEPAWSPDGKQILVTRREKSPTGCYRTHDVLWMFPRTGGKGFEVVRLGSSGGAAPARSGVWSGLDRAQWPAFTPDRRHVYFHSSTFAGADRRLRRIDLETGRIDSVTEGKDRYLSCCGRPDMKRAGAYLAVGAHGEQDGLGTHWEAWAYAHGLSPMETLEAASLDGAHFLGLEEEIGSVEVGKVADLVVLNSNPLDNIRNSTDISYVMKAGRLYKGDSLEELWPRRRPYGVLPWLNEEVTRTDLRPDDFWDGEQP